MTLMRRVFTDFFVTLKGTKKKKISENPSHQCHLWSKLSITFY